MALEQNARARQFQASITAGSKMLRGELKRITKCRRETCNHFGIKCGNQWRGEYISVDDDKRVSLCIQNARESFCFDHSTFCWVLATKPFKLEPTKYKLWANGLKKDMRQTQTTHQSSFDREVPTRTASDCFITAF